MKLALRFFLLVFSFYYLSEKEQKGKENALGFDMGHFVFWLTLSFFAKSPMKTMFFEGSKKARYGHPTGKIRCGF